MMGWASHSRKEHGQPGFLPRNNFHEERFALTETDPHKDNIIAGAPNNSQNNMSNKSEIYYHLGVFAVRFGSVLR